MMSVIERSIQVGYQLRVYFTQAAFDPSNLVVRAALRGAESNRPHKVLVVVDESLAQAQPDLPGQIESYFAAHADSLALVCPADHH
jgi:3-dehydroquinate synthase